MADTGGLVLFSISKWRPGHLLLSWAAYWAALVAVKLGPAIMVASRITRLPHGEGGISALYGDGLLKLTMTAKGVTVWDGATPLSTFALWVAGPPLLIWLVWLLRRPRRETTGVRELSSGERAAAIGAGLPPAMGGARPIDDRAADVVRPGARERR